MKTINGRNNPNAPLYTLYIAGKPASNHAYDFVTAAIVFQDRFFRAKAAGEKVSIDRVRRGRKFVV